MPLPRQAPASAVGSSALLKDSTEKAAAAAARAAPKAASSGGSKRKAVTAYTQPKSLWKVRNVYADSGIIMAWPPLLQPCVRTCVLSASSRCHHFVIFELLRMCLRAMYAACSCVRTRAPGARMHATRQFRCLLLRCVIRWRRRDTPSTEFSSCLPTHATRYDT